jgi:glycosyltransferase involved in cell wall biosynthesis
MPNVQVYEERIPVDDVQLFMQAADVLVIPRKQALNSGNVALGFTFGKVVVGAEHGVIGETLRHTGNPVFDPDQPEQLGKAIREGIRLAQQEKGLQNLQFAKSNLQWRGIADQHVVFYQRLQAMRSRSSVPCKGSV